MYTCLKEAKRIMFPTSYLAQIYSIPEKQVRHKWKELNWKPGFKMVDTCAAEFDAASLLTIILLGMAYDEVEVTEQTKNPCHWFWTDSNWSRN